MFPPPFNLSEYSTLGTAGIFLSSESFIKSWLVVLGIFCYYRKQLGDATEFGIHCAHKILIVSLGTEFSKELIQISVWKILLSICLRLL